MTPQMVDQKITVADLPAVKAILEAQTQRIAELEKECADWEERYDWLLSECGGTI